MPPFKSIGTRHIAYHHNYSYGRTSPWGARLVCDTTGEIVAGFGEFAIVTGDGTYWVDGDLGCEI